MNLASLSTGRPAPKFSRFEFSPFFPHRLPPTNTGGSKPPPPLQPSWPRRSNVKLYKLFIDTHSCWHGGTKRAQHSPRAPSNVMGLDHHPPVSVPFRLFPLFFKVLWHSRGMGLQQKIGYWSIIWQHLIHELRTRRLSVSQPVWNPVQVNASFFPSLILFRSLRSCTRVRANRLRSSGFQGWGFFLLPFFPTRICYFCYNSWFATSLLALK